jgi:hypothetical protein
MLHPPGLVQTSTQLSRGKASWRQSRREGRWRTPARCAVGGLDNHHNFFLGIGLTRIVFFDEIEASFVVMIADRSDFVSFLEMVVTIMSLIVSFTGLIFVETTRTIIDASEPVRSLGADLEKRRLKLTRRMKELEATQLRGSAVEGKVLDEEKTASKTASRR